MYLFGFLKVRQQSDVEALCIVGWRRLFCTVTSMLSLMVDVYSNYRRSFLDCRYAELSWLG